MHDLDRILPYVHLQIVQPTCTFRGDEKIFVDQYLIQKKYYGFDGYDIFPVNNNNMLVQNDYEKWLACRAILLIMNCTPPSLLNCSNYDMLADYEMANNHIIQFQHTLNTNFVNDQKKL
jgi:hypothetical protein